MTHATFFNARPNRRREFIERLSCLRPRRFPRFHCPSSPVAEELARLLGHPVTYLDRSPAEQREALLAAGLSPLVADLLVGLDQMFRESTIAETTSTVEVLTGKAPRSLTEWLTDNLDVFRA